MSKPFAGLRVIDFTQVLAGPYSTYQLASLGADVIKVEHPKGGDQGRSLLTPTPESAEAGMSALSSAVNSGKRSITVDLKHPNARDIIDRLVENADVLVENYKAGTMDKLGFGQERLRALNPKLIYCSISGFGQTGPRSSAAAYDPVIQAAAGIMSVTGFPDNGPTKVGFWVCDMTTGMNAAFAMSSALFRRAHTGVGDYLDVSMLDTAVSLMSPMAGLPLNYDVDPAMCGNGTPASGGPSSVFETADGTVSVAAVTPSQFASMAREVGRPDMAEDKRFTTGPARIENADVYREAMTAAFKADTAINWEERLNKCGVPASKNKTVRELGTDAQLNHREMFQPLTPPAGISGDFHAVNLGFKLAYDGPGVEVPPPLVGQHNDEILREVGFDANAIAGLRERGVIT
ncbi:MAG: CoA transferase [Chromatiales bacterium]|jgi:crotonobetainyl-CoA:carnitine CoA-transferase CaiB-like acyl-CoA transferase|nr:CoA transferase [Chromatiales bacterium]